MRLRFRPFSTAAMFALGFASTPALAQDSGWFIGAGGGISKYTSGCDLLVGPGSCDDNGVYWRAFGGYQFNTYFGYEIGYGSVGEMTRTVTGVGSVNLESKVYDAVLVLTIPLGHEYSLYGKIGVYGFDLDRTDTGAGTTNAKGTEMTYGFGLKWDITKSIALRMEFQRYFDIGDGATGTSNVETSLLGIAFKF